MVDCIIFNLHIDLSSVLSYRRRQVRQLRRDQVVLLSVVEPSIVMCSTVIIMYLCLLCIWNVLLAMSKERQPSTCTIVVVDNVLDDTPVR